jgi:hypothetical protein
MNGKLGLVMFSLLAAIAAVVTGNLSYASDQTSPVETDYFGNGIAVFSLLRTTGIEGKSGSATLVNAKLVKIGDRYFVRGTTWMHKNAVKRASDGVDTAIAWNDVVAFYVFTEDQIEAYIAERGEQ